MNRTVENIRNNHADRIETMEMYDKEYFEKHYNPPYRRSEPRWLDFFNHIAERACPKLEDLGPCWTSAALSDFWWRHCGAEESRPTASIYRITQSLRSRKISKDSAL